MAYLKRPFFCFLLLWMVSMHITANAASPTRLELVRKGKPNASIVVARRSTMSVDFALQELQYHLRQITGITLPVAYDDQKVTGVRILLGESKATKTLKLPGKPFSSQEYMLRFTPSTLVLMGKDDAIYDDIEQRLPRVPGKFGRATKFNGINSYVSLPDTGFTDDEGCMEAWVWMPAKSQPSDGTILRIDSTSPWSYHIVQRLADTSSVDYRVYDGTTVMRVISKPVTEGWHHVKATHSVQSGLLELFVDGASQGTTPCRITKCSKATMYMGGMPGDQDGKAGNAFVGLIDEVRISNSARSNEAAVLTEPLKKDSATTLLLHLDEASSKPSTPPATPQSISAPGYFTNKGTLDAVYEFLERFCGVDWCAPGSIGLVCPKTSSLVVQGYDMRTKPAFQYRWMTPITLLMPTSKDAVSENDAAVWKYRMRLGGEAFWACHSFLGYYDRFLGQHPDWFAQGYTETPPQMCYTNQGFIDQSAKDAREYFTTGKSYPGAAIAGNNFGLVPQDNNSWCKCALCQSKLNASEASNPQFSNGKASNYFFEYVNKVAALARTSDKSKWISTLAYSDYAYYPDKLTLEPNIAVMMCLHTRNWWCPSMEKNDRKVFNQWVSKEGKNRPLYVWLYYNFPAMNAQQEEYAMFPGFFVHTMAKQIRMYHQAGIRGIFLEHSSEFGQTFLGDQLELYVQWHMARNPNLDLEKLIDRFFNGYYGKAAQPMKKLYLDMERVFTDINTYPDDIKNSPAHQHQNRRLTYEYELTPKRLAAYQGLISNARDMASSEIEKRRVGFFVQGIIQPLAEGMAKYQLYKQDIASLAARSYDITVPKLGTSASGDPGTVDWSKATDIGSWRTVLGVKSPRVISTKLAHDGQYLYIELNEQMDTQTLITGSEVWRGDDWELFFAKQKAKPYRQISIAPDGKYSASEYGAITSSWNPQLRVLSDTNSSRYWSCRVAIPLKDLVSESTSGGDSFSANFYRATGGSSNLMAWSPNFTASFHETSHMGKFTLAP
ncbi:MAG: DUF4838 domain-containing protein [Armatimonadota bacterium]